MDAHMDIGIDGTSPDGDGSGADRPKAADPGQAARDGFLRSIEERLAGLVEKSLGQLTGGMEQARRLEAEAAFAAGHPDFAELRRSGRLEEMRRDNPLLDEVGAYFAARLELERGKMAERLEEAVKETERRVLEGLRVRRQAATLSQGQGSAPGMAPEPELADPGRFGGLNAVLARRLTTRRETAGN